MTIGDGPMTEKFRLLQRGIAELQALVNAFENIRETDQDDPAAVARLQALVNQARDLRPRAVRGEMLLDTEDLAVTIRAQVLGIEQRLQARNERERMAAAEIAETERLRAEYAQSQADEQTFTERLDTGEAEALRTWDHNRRRNLVAA